MKLYLQISLSFLTVGSRNKHILASTQGLRTLQRTNRCFTTNRPKYKPNNSSYQTLRASLPMPLNILVVGAGICGPAFAILMQGAEPKTQITVVERHPTLRVAGQQIDLKNQGVVIVKKMGLIDTVKSHCVEETGLEILDSRGKPTAFFGINPAGQQRTALTSEHEIMRGDLVKLLYGASLDQNERLKKQRGDTGKLTYEFGKTITELIESGDGVDVTFTDGSRKRYDLVVGADGQGSRTRRLAFGQEASDVAFNSFGIHGAYFSVPRIEGEEGHAKVFNAPGRKMLVSRTSNRPVTQFLLYTMNDADMLKTSYRQPIEEQRKAFAEAFKDVDWQTDRILNSLRTAEDFYAHELGQIKMKQLYTGRVALLGDAGYCPSPFTGLGVTGCLIGAYVLAGELARHGKDVAGALEAFDITVRPGVDEIQTNQVQLGLFFPSSRLGVWVMHNAAWVMSKLDQLTWRPRSEEDFKRWKVPEYPELNL